MVFTTIRSSKERGCRFSRLEQIIVGLQADLWIVDPHSAQNFVLLFCVSTLVTIIHTLSIGL